MVGTSKKATASKSCRPYAEERQPDSQRPHADTSCTNYRRYKPLETYRRRTSPGVWGWDYSGSEIPPSPTPSVFPAPFHGERGAAGGPRLQDKKGPGTDQRYPVHSLTRSPTCEIISTSGATRPDIRKNAAAGTECWSTPRPVQVYSPPYTAGMTRCHGPSIITPTALRRKCRNETVRHRSMKRVCGYKHTCVRVFASPAGSPVLLQKRRAGQNDRS